MTRKLNSSIFYHVWLIFMLLGLEVQYQMAKMKFSPLDVRKQLSNSTLCN